MCVSVSPRTVAAGDAPTSACTQLHQHISELDLCAFYCIIPAGPYHILGPAVEWKGDSLAEALNPSCEGWSGRAPDLLRNPSCVPLDKCCSSIEMLVGASGQASDGTAARQG